MADGDDRAALKAFVEKNEIEYPVLLGTRDVLRDYRIGSFPTNYYLDALGRVQNHDIGATSRWGFERRMSCAKSE